MKNAQAIRTGISNWSYLTTGFTFVIALFLLPFGTKELIREFKIESGWTKTTATVVGNVENGSHKGRPQYIAEFTFKDSNGNQQTTVDDHRQGHAHEVGLEIPILFDPQDPENARIDEFKTRWLIPMALISFGIGTILFSIIALGHILQIKSAERLRENPSQAGEVHGTYIEAKKNFLLSLKHAKSWRIIAEYRDVAGRVYRFESEPIWDHDPADWAKKETPVPILLDRMNPARGWVRVQPYFLACKT